MRTALVIMAVLVVALLGLDAVASSGSRPRARRGPRLDPVATIARRVEQLRDLRYRHIPVPQSVTPARARRDGLADFDASESPRRQAGEQEVLQLLGLMSPGTTLRQVSASLYGEGVAGYYDPRTGRLKVVSGQSTSTRVLAETVLAHELTHALEDQRFELLGDETRRGAGGNDDASLAATALVEGTATEVMQRYAERYFSRSELLAGAIASAFAPTGDLPPFLESQTLFPYLSGQAFVEYLLRRAGGRWDLVDTAERLRPPDSTEQVMHPLRYLRADEPLPVPIRAAQALPHGWHRALAGTWGELQTRDLLATAGVPDAAAAATGWGGDRWELWRSIPLPDRFCTAPCRLADVLIMRWRWDTRSDEGQFALALRDWVRSHAGHVAVARRHGAVTLALAPTTPMARRAAAAGG